TGSSGSHEHFLFRNENAGEASAPDVSSSSFVASRMTSGSSYSKYLMKRSLSTPNVGHSGASGNHTHSVSGDTGNAGSGSAHNNVQPTIVLNYCIFAGA